MKKFRLEWFIAFQYLLPQHILSRSGGFLAETRIAWIKNILIKIFIRIYKINLDEAIYDSPQSYESFNAFFIRALKKDARPIDNHCSSIVCPADGIVSQAGCINEGAILQAKGKSFSSSTLLGSNDKYAKSFLNGEFITIYLSPKDYHRVHMPIDGRLVLTRYIPGKLFSVNLQTASHIDGLFAKNERLVCIFDTPAGLCAIILVGAMMVAGIETAWRTHYCPQVPLVDYADSKNIYLKKGEEMGRFKFGSTVIVMFEHGKTSMLDKYEPGLITRVGELMTTHEQHQ
jgi:phosphatidylserine decarboxylase|tara:strand:- start:403 stop:1263 length:861 start_codon:yes stop_codon:yes gene_type:complete